MVTAALASARVVERLNMLGLTLPAPLPELVAPLAPGQVVGPRREGDLHRVVRLERREGPVLDRETSHLIQDFLFERWLAEEEARAAIEYAGGATL